MVEETLTSVPLPNDVHSKSIVVNAVSSFATLLVNNPVSTVATLFVGWVSLYAVLHLIIPNKPSEWHCRLVTFLHAAIIVPMALWSMFIEGPWPFTDPAGPNTVIHNVVCMISMAYFIFDFSWCIYYRSEGPVMLFHHILSIFGNGVVLTRQVNGTEMMAAFVGTEITNPLLQLRWFLRYEKLNVRYHIFSEIVDFAFLTLFTVMRIDIGSVLLYRYLLHPRPDWVGRFFSITLYLVGWVFWVSVVRYGLRKFRRILRSLSGKDVDNGVVNNGVPKSPDSDSNHNGTGIDSMPSKP